MTLPLSASTRTYTVTFDGRAVQILAAKRRKVLRRIPVGELAGVEYRPATGIGGGRLRFRTTTKQSARDNVVFMKAEESQFAALASAVAAYSRPVGAPTDPWSGHPVMPAAPSPFQANPAWSRIGRLATLEAGLHLVIAIPALIALAGLCAFGGYLMLGG